MKVWMIWVQGDDATWLESAWDDESTAENHPGWQEEVERVRKLAYDNHYEMRIIEAEVPGVFEAFNFARVTASTAFPRQRLSMNEEDR